MFLKLPFAVSFSVLFTTIQYAVFRMSFIYIYIYIILLITSFNKDFSHLLSHALSCVPLFTYANSKPIVHLILLWVGCFQLHWVIGLFVFV